MSAPGTPPRLRGYPRRKMLAKLSDGTEAMFPNLYVGGKEQHSGDFLTFQDGRARRLIRARECVVCGLPMEGVVILGRYMTRAAVTRRTDGPPGHPRCVNLAVNICPHFVKARAKLSGTVAYLWDGPGCGFQYGDRRVADGADARVHEDAWALTAEELSKIARENPMGVL